MPTCPRHNPVTLYTRIRMGKGLGKGYVMVRRGTICEACKTVTLDERTTK